jgi:hypothetical protein
MALLPYALRPRAVLRRTALRRGVRGNSLFWSAVAGLMVGQGTYVRSQAIRRGVLGGSRSWRALAGLLVLKEAVGSGAKHPENLGKLKVGAGSSVRVNTEKPMTRKQRKAALITKADIKAQASADVAAAWARRAAVNPKRKVVRRAEKTAAMAEADRRAANKRTGNKRTGNKGTGKRAS